MNKRELVKRIWTLILAMGIAVPFGGGIAQSIFAEEDAGLLTQELIPEKTRNEIWAYMDGFLSSSTGDSLSGSSYESSYTEKETKVYTDGEEAGELTLRFYEETPHVPYLGMSVYSQYMKQQPLTMKENGNGTCALVNGIGEELTCDPDAGVITVQDWHRFFDMPLPLEDDAKGWKDSTVHYVRITNVEFDGEPEEVTLDFAKYGIRIYADDKDIYLPVSTLSNVMTDIATNHMLYNGENLYVQRVSIDGTPIKGLYDSDTLRAEIDGEARPDDIVKQCYADLCFNFDHFFGHPGKAPLDEALAEKGLDQALADLGEEGSRIKEGLLSPDFSKYVSAVMKLFAVCLSDGHTVFTGGMTLLASPAARENALFMNEMGAASTLDMLQSPEMLKQMLHMSIESQRETAWGSDVYRESGKTAIIRLDSFMPDEDAWADYYAGEGDLPEDSLGIVVSGLRRAADNPDIENVIFDLSCNGGGSPDVMMAILAMTTGQDQLLGRQKFTGQTMTFTFEADTNLDGVYDEKDKETKYDFNCGVLVTRHAFSCGNLFPFVIQDAGAVIIGESSSGGSCCIQVGTDAEGLSYVMSSGQWQLADPQGRNVEDGCVVDLPIEPVSSDVADSLLSLLGVDEGLPSFENYFDEAMLDEMMNDYFREG